MRALFFRIACFVTPVLAASGCGGTLSLQSQTPAAAPTINAEIDDWAGVLKPVEGTPVSLGVQNDGEYLYLALLTNDPVLVQQIAFRGLIVWFDPAGEQAQAFGIRFPLGLSDRGGARPPGEGPPRRDPDVLTELFNNASLAELEFLNAGATSGARRGVATLPGIEADAMLAYGTLTYELRIPLQQSATHGFAVGAAPGTAISLGLETPEIDRNTFDRMRGDAPGGGFDSPGARGGPGGGIPGRGGFQEPLKLWTTVMLAE